MRSYLVATLIPSVLLAGLGQLMAQSRQQQRETSQTEVLCERIEFGHNFLFGGWAFSFNSELATDEEKRARPDTYGLSSVTVPAGGWKVEEVAIYTNPSDGEKWRKVNRARLNVLAKKGNVPSEDDDPTKGREVEVTVGELKEGVHEVRASNLDLTLARGEYWVGLTPICSEANGFAGHLIAVDVRDASFDDVHRTSGADSSAEARDWAAINPTRPGEHLSIRIEGWHLRRGQLLDWPTDKAIGAKQLHLRFGIFDPVAQPPRIPKELMAPGGNLWIVQCRQTVNGKVRDQLTLAGATLLRYVPDDAYIMRLTPEKVETVRELESVRWIGPYHPAYRLDPSVVPEPFERNGSNLSMRPYAGLNGLPIDSYTFFTWMTLFSLCAVLVVGLMGRSGSLSVPAAVLDGALLLACAAGCFWAACGSAAAY